MAGGLDTESSDLFVCLFDLPFVLFFRKLPYILLCTYLECVLFKKIYWSGSRGKVMDGSKDRLYHYYIIAAFLILIHVLILLGLRVHVY